MKYGDLIRCLPDTTTIFAYEAWTPQRYYQIQEGEPGHDLLLLLCFLQNILACRNLDSCCCFVCGKRWRADDEVVLSHNFGHNNFFINVVELTHFVHLSGFADAIGKLRNGLIDFSFFLENSFIFSITHQRCKDSGASDLFFFVLKQTDLFWALINSRDLNQLHQICLCVNKYDSCYYRFDISAHQFIVTPFQPSTSATTEDESFKEKLIQYRIFDYDNKPVPPLLPKTDPPLLDPKPPPQLKTISIPSSPTQSQPNPPLHDPNPNEQIVKEEALPTKLIPDEGNYKLYGELDLSYGTRQIIGTMTLRSDGEFSAYVPSESSETWSGKISRGRFHLIATYTEHNRKNYWDYWGQVKLFPTSQRFVFEGGRSKSPQINGARPWPYHPFKVTLIPESK